MSTDHDSIAPPPMLYQFLEARAGAEFASLMLMLPLLRMSAPRGDERPVIVLPGFMANDNVDVGAAAVPRRHRLFGHRLGHGTQHRPRATVDRSLDRTRRDVEPRPRPDASISSAGVAAACIAREIARARPDLVRQVITLGTPVKGGPGATSIGRLVQASTGMTEAQMHALIRRRERRRSGCRSRRCTAKPTASFRGRPRSIDTNPDVEHIEVRQFTRRLRREPAGVPHRRAAIG